MLIDVEAIDGTSLLLNPEGIMLVGPVTDNEGHAVIGCLKVMLTNGVGVVIKDSQAGIKAKVNDARGATLPIVQA